MFEQKKKSPEQDIKTIKSERDKSKNMDEG